MNSIPQFKYFDKRSFAILLSIVLISFALAIIFIKLEGIGYLIGSLLIIGIARSVNHIILFDQNFLRIRYLVFLKWIEPEKVQILRCELTGMGRSRDQTIYLYYTENGKLEKSIFMHFKILGSKKFIAFLNAVKDLIEIDSASFELIGIKNVSMSYEKE